MMRCYCDTYRRVGDERGRDLTVGTGRLKARNLSECVSSLGCWLQWL